MHTRRHPATAVVKVVAHHREVVKYLWKLRKVAQFGSAPALSIYFKWEKLGLEKSFKMRVRISQWAPGSRMPQVRILSFRPGFRVREAERLGLNAVPLGETRLRYSYNSSMSAFQADGARVALA